MPKKTLLRRAAVILLTALVCAAPLYVLRGGVRLRPDNPIPNASESAQDVAGTRAEDAEDAVIQSPDEGAKARENTLPDSPAAADVADHARRIAAEPSSAYPIAAQNADPTNPTVYVYDKNGVTVSADFAARHTTIRQAEKRVIETNRDDTATTTAAPETTSASRNSAALQSVQRTGEEKTTEQKSEPKLVTDLAKYAVVLQEERPDGNLEFVAFGTDGDNLTVRVQVRARGELNTQTLKSADGRKYIFDNMQVGKTYDFYLTLCQNGKSIADAALYSVTYQAKLADAEHTQIGTSVSLTTDHDHLPKTFETTNDTLTLKVTARKQPGSEPLYSDSVRVTLTDLDTDKTSVITSAHGSENPEYDLHFTPPNKGDYHEYRVEAVAWSGADSVYWSRTIRFRAVSAGSQAGTVHVKLDMTVLGLDVPDQEDMDLRQGDTAAHVVLRFLQEYGYLVTYDGTPNNGFYIRAISRANMTDGVEVPEALQTMLARDGIALRMDNTDPDSLAERDYTVKSGWMYTVDGVVYDRGLSAMTLLDKAELSIRFTLACGKDIGASPTDDGKLRSYCGVWADGTYTPLSHVPQGDGLYLPDGHIEYTCRNCGQTYRVEADEPFAKTEDNHAKAPYLFGFMPAAVLPYLRLHAKKRTG